MPGLVLVGAKSPGPKQAACQPAAGSIPATGLTRLEGRRHMVKATVMRPESSLCQVHTNHTANRERVGGTGVRQAPRTTTGDPTA